MQPADPFTHGTRPALLPLAAAALLGLGGVTYLVVLAPAFLPPSVDHTIRYARSNPSSWRAGWVSCGPGLVLLALALGTWARSVAPRGWGRAATGLAFAALAFDVTSVGVLWRVPEGGADAVQHGVRLSAGYATALWTAVLLVATWFSTLRRGIARWAWLAVASNGALSAVSLSVAEAGRIGVGAQAALAVVAFGSVPVLLALTAFAPARPRHTGSYS